MSDDQYIYAVARIRSKEMSLLDNTALEQLLSYKSHGECLRFLTERGWGNLGEETAEELLAAEREKTWALMKELVEDMSVFSVFLYSNDFHNLKAAIKQVYINKEVPNIYLQNGTIPPDRIYQAVKKHEFLELPEHMRDCAEEAYQVQMHTGDGQLCDIIIDRAAIETICRKGKESNNPLFEEYAVAKAAMANINIAVRGCRTNKSKDFFTRALTDCGDLDSHKLTEAALDKEEAIYEYLLYTDYADSVVAIKESTSAFERWCDNWMMSRIKPQKYNPFTISPLAAYILARETEIKSVRILLSGKLNDLPEEAIRERLREMYV